MGKKIPFISVAGYKTEFSENILLRSILKTGIDFQDAVRIINSVENQISGRKSIDAEELFEITRKVLLETKGRKFAKRYTAWHKYNLLRRKGKAPSLQILVGGSPAVGKSVSITDIGFRLAISRTMTTDAIRRVLKVVIKDNPVLHLPSYQVWKKLPTKGKVEGFVKQVEFLRPFVEEIIIKSIKDGKDIAIEGVHVVPWILPEELEKRKNVIFALLKAPERKVYREMFFSKRLREGVANKKAIEEDFKVCLKIDRFLVKEAKKRKLPIIKVGSVGQVVRDLLEIINSRIQEIVSSF